MICSHQGHQHRLSLDATRCCCVVAASPASPSASCSRSVTATTAGIAGEESDHDIKAGDDAADDGHDDAADAIDHGHDDLADGSEDRFDLFITGHESVDAR